jgi:hypothetical protein
MNGGWRKWLFLVAALYDGVLGIAFLFFWPLVFELFGVTPPNHGGYVQFPSCLLILFGFLFLRIARDPVGQRDLIPFGMGLKAAYSGLVFWYQITTGVPAMWVPWAWLDLVFLAAFFVAWRQPVPAGAARPLRT